MPSVRTRTSGAPWHTKSWNETNPAAPYALIHSMSPTGSKQLRGENKSLGIGQKNVQKFVQQPHTAIGLETQYAHSLFAWTSGLLLEMRCLKAYTLVLAALQCQQALLDWSTRTSQNRVLKHLTSHYPFAAVQGTAVRHVPKAGQSTRALSITRVRKSLLCVHHQRKTIITGITNL